MRKRIGDIAKIKTGVYLKPTAQGELVYLQAKHFNEEGELSSELFPDIEWQEVSENHHLKPGDVLFAAKGFKNFATVYEQRNLPAVASTSFFVISITKNHIVPEFLAWFLNDSDTQFFLKGRAKGTSIPSISKETLEALEIPIPSLDKQKMVVQIHQTRRKEKQIRAKLEIQKDQQIQILIKQAIDKK